MTTARRQLLAVLLLLGAVGCSPAGAYWRSRGADLLDAVPISVATGWGVGLSGQATPLFQLGLSATPTANQRFGYADRTFYGTWFEYNLHFPWIFWLEDITGLPELPPAHDHFGQRGVPLFFRWQVIHDATSGDDGQDINEPNSRLGEATRNHYWEPNPRSWGRHPPVVREWRGAFLLPSQGGLLDFYDLRLRQEDDDVIAVMGSTERSSLWETRRTRRPTPRQWDLFELDGMLLFLGARVGVRPVEFVDFLLGWFMIDVLADDLPRPVEWQPAGTPLMHPGGAGGASSPGPADADPAGETPPVTATSPVGETSAADGTTPDEN